MDFFTHRPLFHFCSFCEVKFDVIGTMEEFEQDIDYIAKKMNFDKLLDNKEKRANQTPSSSNNKTERIFSYFSLLEKHVKLRLYNLYKMDFEMFGYDATSYM